MGLMDKAKEAALKAQAQAQQLAQQGQAKVAEIKESREEGELFKSLGQAYYEQQRKGGDAAAVATALAAVDTHFASLAENPTGGGSTPPTSGAAPGGATPGASTPGGSTAAGPSGPAGAAPAGDFTLDDV